MSTVHRIKVLGLLSLPLIAVAVLALVLAWNYTGTKSTEAAGGAPEMHIVIPGGSCTGTPGNAIPNLKCTRLVGVPFTVQVQGAGPASPAVGGFQSETFLGGLTNGSKACSVEVTMEPEFLCLGPTLGVGGQISHGNTTGLIPPLPAWTNAPNLVNMPNIGCPQAGQFKVTLTSAPNTPLGSKFKSTTGADILIKSRTLQDVDLDGAGPNVAVNINVADTALVNCIVPPTATPVPPTNTPTNTPTATNTPSSPGVIKSPSLINLFLTRQGSKIPPANCLDGDDSVTLTQTLSTAITGVDKSGDPRSLGGFQFNVKYDATKICVVLGAGPGATNQGMQCTAQDSVTAPTLQGVATIFCVTEGKNVSPPVAGNLQIATITIRPQPEVYSLAKPNNGNGQTAQLLNFGCKLTDRQGDPISPPAGGTNCNDADVTMRYLEGDVEPNCVVDGLDTQAIAFRWGGAKGSLLFNDRFNLMPMPPQFDNIIDVNDLQFVYGRVGSTCANPQPPIPTPVNPKA